MGQTKTRKRPSMLIRGLIRWLEKLLDRYYEGPEPPRRLAEEWRVWLALQQQPDIQMGCS
jgi:hypothetical protein